LYLSLLTDAGSRKIVGWHASDSLEAEGCLRTLQQALAQLPAGARPIHHSDRGTQYCCHAYVETLERRGLAISQTEVQHCYENAQAERVNGILKVEYGLEATFKSKALALVAIGQAIALYNGRRPHQALGYRIPAQVHAEAA
jgi:transposase InsO family protein